MEQRTRRTARATEGHLATLMRTAARRRRTGVGAAATRRQKQNPGLPAKTSAPGASACMATWSPTRTVPHGQTS